MARWLLAARFMNAPSARDRMVAPAITLPSTTLLGRATDQVLERKISGVPITDGDEAGARLVGIVTTTDLLVDWVRDSSQFGSRSVADIMRKPVFTVAPEASVGEVANVLGRERVHRVVVTAEERVLGVVSSSDLLIDVKASGVSASLSTLMVRAISTIDLGTPVDEAITSLELARVHGVVVVDGTRPVGVLTHREALLSRRLPASLRAQPVEEIMSYETICLDDDTPIHRAAAYAMAMRVRRLLVVSKGHLVGIVSAFDLVGTLAASTG